MNWRRSNIGKHLAWFRYLAGPAFGKRIMLEWESKARLSSVLKNALDVINEEIYRVYPGKNRTYKLINSMKVAPSAHEPSDAAASVLYFDADGPYERKDTSQSKDGEKGFSYAYYFEDPEMSFIKKQHKPHRPFFSQLTVEYNDHEQKSIMRVLHQSMKHDMPRTIK